MSAYYDLYLRWVFDLASTMTIKSQATANAINEYLTLQQIEVDPVDQSSWKYYLNLAGEYHSTDVPMTVISTDTLETIEFTKANLKLHTGTRTSYNYGTEYYKDLLRRYPEQELLILGILNPVDITKAISAPDHSILYYDKTLVDENEVNLIPELQKFIDGYFFRYDVADYTITDNLYSAAQLGVLYCQLPKTIINIRLGNCGTDYAHSYHIRQYLKSFGLDDRFFDYLTLKQKLFFYRNIKYICSHTGKKDTFNWLIQKVLTDRNFPIARYTFHQNSKTQLSDLLPYIEFEREDITSIKTIVGKNIKTVYETLTLEDPCAYANLQYKPEYNPIVTEKGQWALDSILQTKILESAVLDQSDSDPYPLEQILLNHWAYFSSIGTYDAYVSLELPVTGDIIALSGLDSFYLYLYCYTKACGLSLVEFPAIYAPRVIVPTRPSLNTLRKYTTGIINDGLLQHAQSISYSLENYTSIEAFRNGCLAIKKAKLLHRDLYAYQQDFLVYMELQQIVGQFYQHIRIDSPYAYTYQDWFIYNNISFADYELDDYKELATQIFNKATGENLNTQKSFREIHKAMVGIMEQLSSYNVQYVTTITPENSYFFDRSHLRHSNISGKTKVIDNVVLNSIQPTSHDTKIKELRCALDPLSKVLSVTHKSNEEFEYDPTLRINPNTQVYSHSFLDISKTDYEYIDPIVEELDLATITLVEFSSPVSVPISTLFQEQVP